MAEGFLLIDKEGGWTSHDVVAKMRRIANIRKVGHAGTLDPMATGLLVIALGRATRLLRFVQGQPKRYVATAVFGIATDSLDADGEIVERDPMPVAEEDVAGVLDRFRGRISQVPPMVSAVKVGGERLHHKARRGEEVERPAREVEIYELAMTSFTAGDHPVVGFQVACSTGTYVRVLADDIARALGGRAHLTELRRTAIGSLHVAAARLVAEVEAMAEDGHLDRLVTPPAEALGDLPAIEVDAGAAVSVRLGRPIAVPGEVAGLIRVVGADGSLLAVYRAEGEQARPEVVLA